MTEDGFSDMEEASTVLLFDKTGLAEFNSTKSPFTICEMGRLEVDNRLKVEVNKLYFVALWFSENFHLCFRSPTFTQITLVQDIFVRILLSELLFELINI